MTSLPDTAVLVLEDGTRHVGRAYGALGTTLGEVVFADADLATASSGGRAFAAS